MGARATVRISGAACALLMAASLAAAQEQSGEPAVTIRGFLSQGYFRTWNDNYLAPYSDEGSFGFTEEALNFTVMPLPRLRVAMQVLGRDLGPQGNHRLTVDWAVGDYRYRDWLGVRIGKIKMPVGLYNTLVDADVARPEIFQPNGAYPLSNRELTTSLTGGSVYGTVPLGPVGEAEYEAWGGTVDVDGNVTVIERVTQTQAASVAATLTAQGLSGVQYQVGTITGRTKYVVGGAFEWRPPVAGLRLRVTCSRAEAVFSALTSYFGSREGMPVALASRAESIYRPKYGLHLSAEYQRGGLRLSGEYYRARRDILTTVSGLGPAPITVPLRENPSTFYGQAAYRLNDHLQLSAYYSVYYADRDDKDGEALVARGQPAHRAWQHELVPTVRVDVTKHWLLKAEVHVLDGTAQLSPHENPDGFAKRWTLLALKTTFHF